jgi:tetratricopeptide (TPR) repeat protein
VGSQLAHLAQVIAAAAIVVSARSAAADDVGDLLKQGSAAYQDGRYDDAIAKLQKAYDLQPKPDTLFALAQAERLGGHCPSAIKHYKQVLEKMTDLETSKLIQGNVALCEKTEAVVTDKPKDPPKDPVPPPPTVTRTIVREHHTDYLAIASVATGTLGLGVGVGLYMASSATRDAAAGAKTLDDNHTLNDRADLQRGLSYVALGAGVGLVGFAIYRWATGHDEEPPATVSLGHAQTPTTVSFITRF